MKNSMAFTRSFFKWAGSKYNCLTQILGSLPPANRLIEPFAGSAVVSLNTHYSSYLLAEFNGDLVAIYKHLQQQEEQFIAYCQQFFIPENNCQERYYELRNQFNSLPQSELRSAIFLYLNRHGYNGLCRYNSKGVYNVPFGRHTKPYFPLKEMLNFSKKSKDMHFIQSDFRNSFSLAKPGDVIYCDPPYVSLPQKSKAFSYTYKKFDENEQIELAELAVKTAAKGIPVIISNHDTEFTRHHYREANIKSFPVSRFINCQPQMRKPVHELIAVFM